MGTPFTDAIAIRRGQWGSVLTRLKLRNTSARVVHYVRCVYLVVSAPLSFLLAVASAGNSVVCDFAQRRLIAWFLARVSNLCEGHCPSGDDPITSVDETDCENVTLGDAGNLCHVECSNR